MKWGCSLQKLDLESQEVCRTINGHFSIVMARLLPSSPLPYFACDLPLLPSPPRFPSLSVLLGLHPLLRPYLPGKQVTHRQTWAPVPPGSPIMATITIKKSLFTGSWMGPEEVESIQGSLGRAWELDRIPGTQLLSGTPNEPVTSGTQHYGSLGDACRWDFWSWVLEMSGSIHCRHRTKSKQTEALTLK